MKTESEIEEYLLKTPRPAPSPEFERKLIDSVRLPSAQHRSVPGIASISFWKRWFPAIGYAVLIMGCVVVMAVQVQQQFGLAREIELLEEQLAAAENAAAAGNAVRESGSDLDLEKLRRNAEEAEELRNRLMELEQLIAQMKNEIGRLEVELANNESPEDETYIEPYDFFGKVSEPPQAEDSDESEISSEKHCVNNMKRIGLALHLWVEEESNGWLPPNLNVLSNTLTKVSGGKGVSNLCCPEDKASLSMAEQLENQNGGWAAWPINGGSYEMLLSNKHRDSFLVHRDAVARCRVHGFTVTCDGGVHTIKPIE